jgi:hypothetical protein
MDARRLFLETLRDLGNKVASGDEYDLVRSSGLIRHLLMDGTSLCDRVNREARVQLLFDVLEPNDPPFDPIIHLSLAPGNEIPQSPARTQKKRDAFLKMRVGRLRGVEFDVHDLISYMAHCAGGVHNHAPDSPAQQAIADLEEAFLLFGRPLTLHFLSNLGRIVIAALEPLRQKLQ